MSIPGIKGEGVDRPESDDASLVNAALAGHPEAFDILVVKYRRQAVSVAYRVINDAAGAEDVAQEAFVRAYNGLKTLKEPGRFRPWLLRIVNNLAMNYRRSRRKERRFQVVDSADGEGTVDLADPKPPDTTNTAELEEVIAKALEALPKDQQVALKLFSMEGLPQKEVAEIMGTTVPMVKWLVFTARQTLSRNSKLQEYRRED